MYGLAVNETVTTSDNSVDDVTRVNNNRGLNDAFDGFKLFAVKGVLDGALADIGVDGPGYQGGARAVQDENCQKSYSADCRAWQQVLPEEFNSEKEWTWHLKNWDDLDSTTFTARVMAIWAVDTASRTTDPSELPASEQRVREVWTSSASDIDVDPRVKVEEVPVWERLELISIASGFLGSVASGPFLLNVYQTWRKRDEGLEAA